MWQRYKSLLPKNSEVEENHDEVNVCIVYILSMDNQFVSHMLWNYLSE